MKQVYISFRENLIKKVRFLILLALCLSILHLFFTINLIQGQILNTSFPWYELPYFMYDDYKSQKYFDPSYYIYFNAPWMTNNFKAGFSNSWSKDFEKDDQFGNIDIWYSQGFSYNLNWGISPPYWISDFYWKMITRDYSSPPRQLDFQDIELGTDSCYNHSFIITNDGPIFSELKEATLFKIETQEELEDFWSKHRGCVIPVPEAPLVDFEKEVIIALIDTIEPPGGYNIEIKNLVLQDENFIVKATKTGPDCLGPWITTQPYHIITTPKSNSNESFSLTLNDQSTEIVTMLDFQDIELGASCYSNSFIIIDDKPLLPEPTLFKIETREELEDFWLKHKGCVTPLPEAPLVAFEKEVIIALIDTVEFSTGYSVEIEKLVMKDENVIVKATKVSPGPNCFVAWPCIQPCHIIKTAKNNKPFSLTLTNVTQECQ